MKYTLTEQNERIIFSRSLSEVFNQIARKSVSKKLRNITIDVNKKEINYMFNADFNSDYYLDKIKDLEDFDCTGYEIITHAMGKTITFKLTEFEQSDIEAFNEFIILQINS